jgi:Cu(I)/Ag(I) efflux system membrane fusion protein
MTRVRWLGSLLVVVGSACQPRAEPEQGRTPNSVIEPYLAIGETLAADSTQGLAALGAELAAAAQGHDQPGLDDIAADANQLRELGKRGELEPARAVYREISHDLLEYLDVNPDQREGLILAYCPMTFANEGAYWLQRGDTLLNPYEGSRMLHCGAILDWDEGVEHRARWAAAHAGDAR